MNEKEFDRILKADNSLRKAVCLREEKKPPMPASLNGKLMQRIKEEVPAKPQRLIWPWIAAACVAAIMVVLLMPPRTSREEMMPSQPSVAKTEKKQATPKSEVTIAEEPKTIVVAETTPKAKDTRMAMPKQQISMAQKKPVTIATETAEAEIDIEVVEHPLPQAQPLPQMLTERDIPITRPENYEYTPEEIALMKKQAREAYLKWVELELRIAKYNQEQTANNNIDL